MSIVVKRAAKERSVQDVNASEDDRRDAQRIAKIIRRARKDAGLSQVELANRLRTSQARVSEIERGQSLMGPTYKMLKKLAEACDTNLILKFEKKSDIPTKIIKKKYTQHANYMVRKFADGLRDAGILTRNICSHEDELNCLMEFINNWEISIDNADSRRASAPITEVSVTLRMKQPVRDCPVGGEKCGEKAAA